MTKDEYWQAHVTRNPSFKDEDKTIQISIKMLRQLMEEAYDKGAAHAAAEKPAIDISSVFGSMKFE